MPTSPASDYILTIDGPQRPGIVHALTGFLLEHHGDIIEQGSHAELLAAGGAYAELYRSQFA